MDREIREKTRSNQEMAFFGFAFGAAFLFQKRARGCRYIPCPNSIRNHEEFRRMKMAWRSLWKLVFSIAGVALLAGNFACVRAQGRPEAPPFDASHVTML